MARNREPDYTKRTADVTPFGPGETINAYMVEINLHHFEEDAYPEGGNELIGVETAERYTFAILDGIEETANVVKHDDIDTSNRVVYIGNTMYQKVAHINEEDLADVPSDAIEAIAEKWTIVTGIDCGWFDWNGRPEFSESYVDFSEISDVDIQ